MEKRALDDFDCHVHTTKSDGLYTPVQAVVESIYQQLQWVICTNHDHIDHDFVGMAKASGIQSMPAVEITCYDNERLVHCLVYGKEMPSGIETRLDDLRLRRIHEIVQKLKKLQLIGFECDIDEFFTESQSITESFYLKGNIFITRYLFPTNEKQKIRNEINQHIYRELTGRKFEFQLFIRDHLNPRGIFPFGSIPFRMEYSQLSNIQSGVNGPAIVKSLAHPDITYYDMGPVGFTDHAIKLIRGNVIQALEVSVTTPPEWIEALKFVRTSTDCILTFGSDCHFRERRTEKSRWLGKLNQDFSVSEKKSEFNKLLETTGH